ncbi:MAG: T9SS type A sorting domain-containing protein [bacterium]
MKSLACIFLLLLPLTPQAKPANTFSQAIQLETGWNLVSWYVWPVGNGLTYPSMDDIFDQDTWFDSDQTDITDMVGKFDEIPRPPSNHVYPIYGYDEIQIPNEEPWIWNLAEAYYVYMESPAHFWEASDQPDFEQEDFNFTPNSAWDDSIDGDPNNQSEFWYFLGYPLRKSVKIDTDNDGWSDNPTIADLEDPNNLNPMIIIRSDDGKRYVSGYRQYTNLFYLEPGRGYFLGFTDDDLVSCLGFENEVEPESAPPDPKSSEQGIDGSTASHFTYKSRTHWWYPVEIDTLDLLEYELEAGDEIAVFDGSLCVGATVYNGEFPIHLTAWKDDIATSSQKDGYDEGNEMTFVWFDISENQEITFEVPPTTASALDDPIAPTHSGFGSGFYARRSLTDGVSTVTQLPTEFKLSQNYPNPFNAETMIPLQLPQRSQVRIELFNIRGQRVRTIYDGIESAGLRRISFNAGNLPSGVYFYKINATGLERKGGFQDVGKMLLLK